MAASVNSNCAPAGPLRRRVGRCDELWHHVACSTPGGIIKVRQIILHGALCRRRIDIVSPFVARGRAALVGVSCDQARIDGKAFATDQTCPDAGSDNAFEHLAENVVLTEALVACAREGRMIGDPVFDAEAAELAISEIELNLAAQRAFRTDREHVPKNEHPDHQFRIDRRPSGV